jgi:hypothetical protein
MSQHSQPAARGTTRELLKEALNTHPADFEHDADPNYDDFRLWFLKWQARLAELEPYL